MINLSKMTKEHIDGVMNVDRTCFSTPWSEKSFLEEMENEHTNYFVAEKDGKVIGYGGIWILFGEGDITNIAVLPEYRRCGVGKMILEALIKNTESARLEVRKSNGAAIGLYEKTGFKQIGIRKKYYADNGEDALIMERKNNN